MNHPAGSDPANERDPGGRESGNLEGARFAGLGLTLALSVLLFLGAGWWLDGRLGTAPLFTILGSFVGMGAGGYYVYAEVTRGEREGPDP